MGWWIPPVPPGATSLPTATLNAVFGGDDLPDDRQLELSGMINNFKDGVSGDDLGFTVNLTAIELDIAMAPYTSTTVNAAHGTISRTPAGTWDATFFGPIGVADADPDNGDEAMTTLPTGVAGNFNAHFPDAACCR